MKNFCKNNVILIRYPFTNLISSKVRPAVIVSAQNNLKDLFIVPITSKTDSLIKGEFILKDWQLAGLNVSSAIKRGIFTIHQDLVLKTVGTLTSEDADQINIAIKQWLELK